MIRKSSFGRSYDVTAGKRLEHARLQHEPLEDRRMLAAYINEIYIDPPSGAGDQNFEYIELRTDNANGNYSLANHYLIVLENEGGNNTGQVETVFDLSGMTFGSNGFLVLRQKNTQTASPQWGAYAVDGASGDYSNTGTGGGWGSGATSSLAVSDLGNDGALENSGGTFMLVHNVSGTAPFINQATPLDLDTDGNGLDNPNGQAGWQIVDSIGIHGEFDDPATGRLYAPINFGSGPTPVANLPASATYVDILTDYNWGEIEYIGRWGNSTGQTANDWHVSNLTNDLMSPYTGGGDLDFRQSGDPHEFGQQTVVETSHDVAYGTNLTDTLGKKNFQNATITGRRLFYANSAYETEFGDRASAIATDKVAYIPNGSNSAGPANVSSYVHGITGIMVEITNPDKILTAADFQVRMSEQYLDVFNTVPSAWAAAPAFTLTRVANTPSTGTDRYELVWADGAIKNRYAYVIVEGADALSDDDGDMIPEFNVDTGLPTSDFFFFGNIVGETFNTAVADGFFAVEPSDQIAARFNQGSYQDISFIENLYDFNRDFNVDPSDQIIARFNENFLLFFSTSNPPAAPLAGDGDGSESAVASALAGVGAANEPASATVPGFVETPRAATAPLTAAWSQLVAESDGPGGPDAQDAFGEVVDVDDELLDALTSDLSG